ncbi:MAG: UvrD-helicase domain-containing protein [bacterium]|nr:UvrD-helicase domain-containing protein [bacterium]
MSTQPTTLSHEAIIASAGTGKTERLALRYLALLQRECDLGSILALTFTRVAAGEMLERIVVKLAEATRDPHAAQRLGAMLPGGGTLTSTRAGELLQRLVLQLPRVRISTLDSFLLHIVRCFALEVGWPLNVQLLDEADEAALHNQALAALSAQARRVVHRMQNFNTVVQLLMQEEAPSQVEEKLREACLAPYRVYLRTRGEVAPWQAFRRRAILTDTELAQLCGPELVGGPTNGASRFEKELEAALGDARNGDWPSYLQRTIVQNVLAGKDSYGRRAFSHKERALLQRLAAHAVGVLVNRAIDATQALYTFLRTYDAELISLKEQRGAYTFDDVTRKVADAAQMLRMQEAELFFRLDGHIRHVLIDEFQDTSWEQWSAVHPLVDEILCDTSRRRSYFMVGDMKQAIYGWRGGEARLMKAILERYGQAIATRAVAQSWRAGQCLLDVVNAVFLRAEESEFGERLEAWRAFTQFAEHTADPAAQRDPGYCELRVVARDNADEPAPDDDSPRAGQDPCMRAAAALLCAMRPWEYGWKTALLFRTNAEADEMLSTLRAAGVPCYLQGKSRLCDNPAVQAVLKLLEWADQPFNALAAFHVRTSFLGAHMPSSPERAAEYLAAVRGELLRRSYAEWIERLVRPFLPQLSEEHQRRLLRLIDLAAQYQPRVTPRPSDFVRWLEEVRQTEPPASEGVVCSTIHNAKGKTYDIVFLPNLQINPNRYANAPVYLEEAPAQISDQADSAVAPAEGAVPASLVPQVRCVLCRPRTQEKTIGMVDAEFEALRQAAETKKWHEYFNLMYVALTRAARAMYLFCDDKPEKNTFARWVRDALESRCADTYQPPSDFAHLSHRVAYFTPGGNPSWYKHQYMRKLVCAPPKVTQPLGELFALSIVRHRHQLRPSAHTPAWRAAVYFQPASRAAALFGTALHAVFQQVEWLDNVPPDDELVRVVQQSVPALDPPRCAEVVRTFHAACALPEVVAALTRPAEPCEVRREVAFSVIVREATVHGVCDRVVCFPSFAAPQRIYICDYKSDLVRDEEEQAVHRARYATQLEIYREALSEAYGLPREAVSAELLFVCRTYAT